jgi:hypothetical protein
MGKDDCGAWYGCKTCYPNGETPVGRVLAVARYIEDQRRASADLRASWAAMAGQQDTPSAVNAEGVTTSTVSGGSDGCSTDGA